jgi:hypothetical protein
MQYRSVSVGRPTPAVERTETANSAVPARSPSAPLGAANSDVRGQGESSFNAMTAQELRLHTLRRLHELAEANGYHYLFSLDEIAAEVGVDDRLKVLSLGQDLEADGLVTLSATQGGTKAAIKMRGVQVVEDELSNPRSKTVSIKAAQDANSSLDSLLHTVIREHAYPQYLDGHWRDAVLNAFIAVFDLIRNRTGLDLDGDALVTRAFSIQRPMLMLSDLRTESGRNDQAGFFANLSGCL